MSGAVNGHRAQDGTAATPVAAIAPLPPRAMMATRMDWDDSETVLWCDPLTGLIAYPSFAAFLTAQLPRLVAWRLHLAIGDVDDLKQYVTERRTHDPTCFGHLAGNECMEGVGRVTRQWAEQAESSWPFVLCGTFGGDEVIIAAAGGEFGDFVADIRRLTRAIGDSVPRTCSFSVGTLVAEEITPENGARAYRHFVSRVDEALFAHKAMLRRAGIDPRGDFVDIGTVTFDPSDPRSDGPAEPPAAPIDAAANTKGKGL